MAPSDRLYHLTDLLLMLSPYISNLRKKVGGDLLLLPSVTVLVTDEARRVLLVRHSDKNVWVAPGGMVEPDETPQQAAIREMQEETGCAVELLRITGAFGGPEFRLQYQNGDRVAYVMTVFEARIVGGKLQPDGEETLETRFFSFEETKHLPCGKWLPTVLTDFYRNQPATVAGPSR